METRELRYDEKAAIRFALRHKAHEMLDGLVTVLLFEGCDKGDVEAEMFLALSEMDHDIQHWWLDEACPCGAAFN